MNTGSQLEPDRYYRYVAEYGVMEVPERMDSIRGSALIALRTGVFDDDRDLREAKRLMRRVIASHLGGRSLRSRELFIGPRT
jgi:DNA repair protein RecO (recombination protein O)